MLEKLNNICKKYSDLITTVMTTIGIVMILIGYFFQIQQINQNSLQLDLLIDRKVGEETPHFDFDNINPMGVFKVKPSAGNVKFQWAKVTYSKEFRGKISNPPAMIHDSNWYLPGIKAFWLVGEEKKKELSTVDSYKYKSTPIGLTINFIQYGKARLIKGLYLLRYMLTEEKNEFGMVEYDLEFLGVYLVKYVTVDTNLEILVDQFEDKKKKSN